jgi:hypothetical protein
MSARVANEVSRCQFLISSGVAVAAACLTPPRLFAQKGLVEAALKESATAKKLVDRFLAPTVMLETARFFLVNASDRQHRFYSNFSPKLHHGDEPILKVQQWLQTFDVSSLTVSTMADKGSFYGLS